MRPAQGEGFCGKCRLPLDLPSYVSSGDEQKATSNSWINLFGNLIVSKKISGSLFIILTFLAAYHYSPYGIQVFEHYAEKIDRTYNRISNNENSIKKEEQATLPLSDNLDRTMQAQTPSAETTNTAAKAPLITKPSYPDCILNSLKDKSNSQFIEIFNITKMCLMREETPINLNDADLTSEATATFAQSWSSKKTVLRITLRNKTEYIITSLTVRIDLDGKTYTHKTRGFSAVNHGGGIPVGPPTNVMPILTIEPGDTREFDVITNLDSLPTTQFNWSIESASGIHLPQ